MGDIEVARWNGVNFLVPKHMQKSKIVLLEQIWAKNPYVTFFLGHPVHVLISPIFQCTYDVFAQNCVLLTLQQLTSRHTGFEYECHFKKGLLGSLIKVHQVRYYHLNCSIFTLTFLTSGYQQEGSIGWHCNSRLAGTTHCPKWTRPWQQSIYIYIYMHTRWFSHHKKPWRSWWFFIPSRRRI